MPEETVGVPSSGVKHRRSFETKERISEAGGPFSLCAEQGRSSQIFLDIHLSMDPFVALKGDACVTPHFVLSS